MGSNFAPSPGIINGNLSVTGTINTTIGYYVTGTVFAGGGGSLVAGGPTGSVQYNNNGQLGSSPSVIIGPSGFLTGTVLNLPSSSFTSSSFGLTGSLTGGFSLYTGKALDGIQQPLMQGALQTYRVPIHDPGWQPFSWRPATAIASGTNNLQDGLGITITALGQTITSSAITTGSFRQTIPSVYISGGTPNNYCDIFSGINGNEGIAIACVGANPGEGGIYITYKFSIPVDPVSSSMFCGLAAPMPGGTTAPMNRSHHIGISYEQTDSNTGSYYLSHRGDAGETATRIALSSSTPGVRADLLRSSASIGEQVIILELLNPPGSGSNWNVRIRTQQSASSYTEIFNGIITSSLPRPGYGLVTETYILGNNAAMRYYGIQGAYGGGFFM